MTRPDLADRRDLDDVYGAAEDSELLAGAALEVVNATVETDDSYDTVLDVGTGSGYVAVGIAETGIRVIGSDLNPHACKRAREHGIETVRGNLCDPFDSDVFDLVVFNPPYLPTPSEQEWDDWMERALSGGESGRRVIDPFLDSVGRVLTPDGTVLLLVSTLTGVDAVEKRAAENGFSSSVVAEESYPFEKLLVLRLDRGSRR